MMYNSNLFHEMMLKLQQQEANRSSMAYADYLQKKSEAAKRWEQDHPPCPHCGQRELSPEQKALLA